MHFLDDSRVPPYDLTYDDVFMVPRHSAVGSRDDVDFMTGLRSELPAHVTVGAAASAELVRPGGAVPSLALTVRAENLLDERYEQTFGFPGRRRMLFAGVRAGL